MSAAQQSPPTLSEQIRAALAAKNVLMAGRRKVEAAREKSADAILRLRDELVAVQQMQRAAAGSLALGEDGAAKKLEAARTRADEAETALRRAELEADGVSDRLTALGIEAERSQQAIDSLARELAAEQAAKLEGEMLTLARQLGQLRTRHRHILRLG